MRGGLHDKQAFTLLIALHQSDIGWESQFLPTTPAFDTPVEGGPRWNIAIRFGMEKLE